MILCILVGSFCVYCTQSAMTGRSAPTGGSSGSGSGSGGTSGPVGNAMGDTCCSAPARETPTVIFDDPVTPSPVPNAGPNTCTLVSPVFDVSAFRTVVIHTPKCGFAVQVRNGKAGFVFAALTSCDNNNATGALAHALTVDTLLGHDLRVNFNPNDIDASNPEGLSGICDAVPLTVVGFKNP
jgi:hypothetical protein